MFTQLTYYPKFTAYNNLSGTIPQEILLLKDLKYLNFGNQYFYGTIPLDVGLTTQLEELHLGKPCCSHTHVYKRKLTWYSVFPSAGNALSGTIPTTINYLNRLSVFDAGTLSYYIPTYGRVMLTSVGAWPFRRESINWTAAL